MAAATVVLPTPPLPMVMMTPCPARASSSISGVRPLREARHIRAAMPRRAQFLTVLAVMRPQRSQSPSSPWAANGDLAAFAERAKPAGIRRERLHGPASAMASAIASPGP